MTALYPLEEIEDQEFDDVGSYNHSTVQANVAYVLKRLGSYSVSCELSLDSSSLNKEEFSVGSELKPDVCIYPKRGLSKPFDVLKMAEMPLLAVEILSPRQGQFGILQKFEAYFALGIRSCWLVDTTRDNVTVYKNVTQYHTFTDGDVVDDTLSIAVSLSEIFEG